MSQAEIIYFSGMLPWTNETVKYPVTQMLRRPCFWVSHFIFNYKGKIVPYVQQRCARGGLPWQRITTWIPACCMSAPVLTHSPIWPGCREGGMPQSQADRPTREFLSGQFVAGLEHFLSPPLLRGPGTLWIWPIRFSILTHALAIFQLYHLGLWFC